ncbi:MATE family efflux transporter [Halocalculus aciditolerans]|uniref:Multidrug-efflux transporter n=1 Tax=Halocalculus aciditolerans TaxID=1383812 RepID=A0A830F739_9EURY|nr:MATE family efflux transporter [Halocalculus aciditolerans]GGL45749.1 MATE family efflux transporter [Halocalculus aciditolerans]
MLDVSDEDIVDGPITRTLLVLAAPLVAQNFVVIAQQVVDLFWVGRLGEPPVAALGLLAPVIGLLSAGVFVVFVGAQVNVAQRAGADEPDAAIRTAVQGALLGFAAYAVVTAAVLALVDPVFARLPLDAAVAGAAAAYLGVYALGLAPMAASNALEAGLVGFGDTRGAFVITAATIGTNVVLDPLLIFGYAGVPALGIRGAALATALGYVAGLLTVLVLVARGRRGFRLRRSHLAIDAALARDVIDVGGPNGVQNAARQVARLLVVGVVSAAGGAAGLAAYTVGARVATIAFVPPQGLGQAASSIIGQSLGADRPDRAERTTWVGIAVACGGLLVVGALQWRFPAAIAHAFAPTLDGQALAHTVSYLRILAYGYWAFGAIYVFEAGFNGASRTRVSMVMTMLQYWAVRLPVAAVGALALGFGVTAVFWAVTASNVAAAVGAGVYYRYSTRNGMLERAADAAGS